MIRQAISCDICGAEKKETNHWFVACETAGELRVSGWNSRNRLRAGSKHLCGQACLHKLADDFMARVIGGKGSHAVEATVQAPDTLADTSLLNAAAALALEMESATRLMRPPEPIQPRAPQRSAPLVRMPERGSAEGLSPLVKESARVDGFNRREEAWRRERERTLRASERA